MIGLVFNQPPKTLGPFKKVDDVGSWWVGVSRDSWAATVYQNWLDRLKYQRAIQEPTAPRETPDWQKQWRKRGVDRIEADGAREQAQQDVDRETE